MGNRQNKVKLTWSDNFAYVIGIIATDGNLSKDLRHIIITSKDYEMMLNCKKCLGIENKISKKVRGGEKEKKYYVLQFGDINFYNFLLELGLTSRKSKTISELKIPFEYFPHFLRGCIDGDGSLSISYHPESIHPQYKIRIYSASKNFLDWILFCCKKTFTLKGGTISKFGKNYVYTLRFGKADSIEITKTIYQKNVICLSRKKDIAIKMLTGE